MEGVCTSPGFLECSTQHSRARGSLSSCLHTQGSLQIMGGEQIPPPGLWGTASVLQPGEIAERMTREALVCVRCDALKEEEKCWNQRAQAFMRMGGQEDGPRESWQVLLPLWGSSCCCQGPETSCTVLYKAIQAFKEKATA